MATVGVLTYLQLRCDDNTAKAMITAIDVAGKGVTATRGMLHATRGVQHLSCHCERAV